MLPNLRRRHDWHGRDGLVTYASDNPQFDHLINNLDSDEVPYERATSSGNSTASGTIPGHREAEDERAALAYWSENIRPTLGDLPLPGLRYLRDRYVLDAQANPEALAQLRDWWANR